MSYTSNLLAGAKPGRVIVVCSVAPYRDQEVEYAPRNSHDSSPWALVIDGTVRRGFRYSGRECHLHTLRFVLEDAGRAGFAVIDTTDGRQVGDYISSRYAAKDAAQRYESNAELAAQRMQPGVTVHGTDDMRQVVRSLNAAPASPVIGYNISVRKLAARLGCDLEAVVAAARRLMTANGLESVVAFYEEDGPGSTATVDAERIVLKQAAANTIYAELAQ